MSAVTTTIGMTTAIATVPDVPNPPPDLEASLVGFAPADVDVEKVVC